MLNNCQFPGAAGWAAGHTLRMEHCRAPERKIVRSSTTGLIAFATLESASALELSCRKLHLEQADIAAAPALEDSP